MHGCFSAMVPVAALGTENEEGRLSYLKHLAQMAHPPKNKITRLQDYNVAPPGAPIPEPSTRLHGHTDQHYTHIIEEVWQIYCMANFLWLFLNVIII